MPTVDPFFFHDSEKKDCLLLYYIQFCCNFAALRYRNMDTNLNIELKLKIVITAFFVVMMMFFSPYKIAAQDNPYKIDNDLYNLYQKAYNAKKTTRLSRLIMIQKKIMKNCKIH